MFANQEKKIQAKIVFSLRRISVVANSVMIPSARRERAHCQGFVFEQRPEWIVQTATQILKFKNIFFVFVSVFVFVIVFIFAFQQRSKWIVKTATLVLKLAQHRHLRLSGHIISDQNYYYDEKNPCHCCFYICFPSRTSNFVLRSHLVTTHFGVPTKQ